MNSPSEVKIIVHSRKSTPSEIKRLLTYSAKATLAQLPLFTFRKMTRNRKSGVINIALVGPKTIQNLNSHYRNKSKPTDVLSFSRMEMVILPFPTNNDLGDVLICWTIAKKQARKYDTPLKEELARLTVHGVLHLFGYDHERSPSDEKKMFQLQDKILKKLAASKKSTL